MENLTLTKYVAEHTMELKDTNLCSSFVSLIWRDKPLTVVYDNLNNQIVDTWFNPVLQEGDIKVLTKLVKKFLT